MSDPTRAQIEADVTRPTYTVEYHNGSTWVAVADELVQSVSGLVNTGGGSSGLDFGANGAPRVTVELDDTSVTAAIPWERTRVRVRFGFAGSNELARLTGIIADQDRSYGDGIGITWQCTGFDQLIRDTGMYSPMFYRRLAATATTISSVEDPTNVAYVGGLVNYIFWQAGGRPLAQAGSYPTAVFYYQCDNALIAPEWSWIAGENGWAELDRICRAVGGQVFQQPDGTMRFVNVLAPTPTSYVLDEGDYASLRQQGRTGEFFSRARCSFTARALQPQQVVYEDTSPRIIAPGATITFTIEPQLPIYDWHVSGASTIPAECYTTTDFYGRSLAANTTAAFVSRSAGRAEVSFTNTHATLSMILSRIALRGRPVAPIEEGQASYGSGTVEKAIGDGEIYVQSRIHAERLCRIYVDIYGQVRPTRRATGLGYDPDRQVGEVVQLTCAAWGLSAVNHRIVSIEPRETGRVMDLSLTPITGILTTNDLFMIGTTYASGDVRSLGY